MNDKWKIEIATSPQIDWVLLALISICHLSLTRRLEFKILALSTLRIHLSDTRLLESILLGKIRPLAPDFLFIEFVNVFWIKTQRGELTETEAIEKITQLIALSPLMEIIPSRAILLESFRASRNYEQAAYDAAFLALAESRSASFVTADEKLYRKIRAVIGPMPAEAALSSSTDQRDSIR
ncbi:MAG: type II toxin-antitoxin system VapC family toxin [bacterium]